MPFTVKVQWLYRCENINGARFVDGYQRCLKLFKDQKTFHDHQDDAANVQNQTFKCTEDEVCSIEYVRMPIEYAEQGVVKSVISN